jgi:hypothetical protein
MPEYNRYKYILCVVDHTAGEILLFRLNFFYTVMSKQLDYRFNNISCLPSLNSPFTV